MLIENISPSPCTSLCTYRKPQSVCVCVQSEAMSPRRMRNTSHSLYVRLLVICASAFCRVLPYWPRTSGFYGSPGENSPCFKKTMEPFIFKFHRKTSFPLSKYRKSPVCVCYIQYSYNASYLTVLKIYID